MQPFNIVMQKEIDILELTQELHFEFIESNKKQRTMYLVTFDDPYEKTFNLKVFADTASAGRHRELNTFTKARLVSSKQSCGRR